MLTTSPLLSFALGFVFATFIGHCIVSPVVNELWELAEADFKIRKIRLPPVPVRANKTLRFWSGVTERAFYFFCVFLHQPQGIAVWLAFKAVIRWKISEDPDPRHIPGSLIYLIGTAMNIALGVIGGFIALGRWSF